MRRRYRRYRRRRRDIAIHRNTAINSSRTTRLHLALVFGRYHQAIHLLSRSGGSEHTVADPFGIRGRNKLTASGSSEERSIYSLAMQGLLWQLACYHFETSRIKRLGYALSTCFSVYVTANRGSNIGESRIERSFLGDHDANDEHTTTGSNKNGLNKITIFIVVATLLFTIIAAMDPFTDQLSANNCISSVHQIDHTHWEAIV